jgi:hypothetical protein
MCSNSNEKHISLTQFNWAGNWSFKDESKENRCKRSNFNDDALRYLLVEVFLIKHPKKSRKIDQRHNVNLQTDSVAESKQPRLNL